ncbi:DnaD domain protein [Laceyella putida]|uniref:DnaD domain protein n=1 Tax=Laceyella putida TaxID=110101 RepID=A0ABW2RKF5_9BACL
MTTQEKQLLKMENTEPIEFLRLYTGGQPISKQLVQLVYELKKNYAFSNGVVNALFEHCLVENNYKIVRTYVLQLADELDEAGVRNAQEVFRYLRERQYQKQPQIHTAAVDPDVNMEYVETNIALIAKQLHELRKDVNTKFRQMNQQLEQIERRLAQVVDSLK